VRREEARLEVNEFVVDAGVNDDVVCRLELALPPGALAKEKEHEDSA
jgi:hypothetical protein